MCLHRSQCTTTIKWNGVKIWRSRKLCTSGTSMHIHMHKPLREFRREHFFFNIKPSVHQALNYSAKLCHLLRFHCK